MADMNEAGGDAEDAANDLLPLYSISSWGADYTVEVIVGRLKKDDIFIPPFQRNFVWTQTQASRFVESLIFGLPVPGVFLSKEMETNRLLVIDGQQRLTSLWHFYEGIFEDRVFALKGVHSDLEGLTYKTLPPELRRRLDDSTIHATIVKQESPEDRGSSVYQIFERLNTGGKQLSSQEIRSAVYYGDLVEVLRSLNEIPEWREMYGPTNKHMKDQEYILRFLALCERHESYKRPMTAFLNNFIADHKKLSPKQKTELATLFSAPVKFLRKVVGVDAFKPDGRTNLSVFDAVLVATSKRLQAGPIKNEAEFLNAYEALIQNPTFRKGLEPNTTDEAKIKARFSTAIKAFSEVK